MKDKRKILIIMSSAILFIAIGLLVFFAIKSHNDEKKYNDENNYKITFKYYDQDKLDHKVKFIYEEKKLKDIELTFYFKNKATAKAANEEYSKVEDFSSTRVNDNKIIALYSSKYISEYKNMTKDDIITLFKSRGYTYKK